MNDMAFTYLVVDMFSVVFLLVLSTGMRETTSGLTENRCFRMIVLLTIAALLSDMVAWQLDGKTGVAEGYFLWLFNILCYVVSGIISYLWLYYTALKLNRDSCKYRTRWIFMFIPSLILTLISISTPWTGLMFTLDENNRYIRGPLFVIQIVTPLAYLFAAAIWALIMSRRERLRQQRKECLYLSLFIIFPLLGGIIQIAVYGLSLAWPCTALSLMLVFISLQNQKISLDALTGLNNRGQFDKYLYNCIEHADDNSEFVLFMLDIDNFKKINDVYGHIAGDAALISAVSILKKAIKDNNAFLARYGGDEFTIVLHYSAYQQIEELLCDIEKECDVFNNADNAPPYKIVFSIGYVQSDCRRFLSYQDMINSADALMYVQKKKHKAAR